MTKKYYEAPEAEIELFDILSVITTSGAHGGSGDGGNDGGDMPDEDSDADAVVINAENGDVIAYLDEYGNEIQADY